MVRKQLSKKYIMKKLIMLASIVISSLTAFSQKGTDSIPSKSFPIPVVKMMVKDILSGDSAKAQLRVTNQQLEETKKMVSIKDSIINKLELKNSNSEIIINSERDKFVILDEQLKKTEKELKREKTKTKIFKSLTTIGTLVIGALLITN
jgi:maltose-binding protein MalE